MKSCLFILCILTTLFYPALDAGVALRNGKLVEVDELAYMSVQEHYSAGAIAFEQEDWWEAARQFRIVTQCFPQSPYASDAFYYMGIAYYNSDELDYANEAFTGYMASRNNPKFFQDAVEYKFSIAEKFACGTKRRILGTKKLPKWLSGKGLALKIYDEVIAALPGSDMAVSSFYSKGNLLWDQGDYRGAVEAFQMLTKRYPKHELAPEAYVAISQIFLEQSEYEFQNPDILAFALINQRRFKQEFPKEERVAQIEADVLAIKEIYAKGLYETGQFYERVNKPLAAIIYYQSAVNQFPETCMSQICLQRLECLQPCTQENCEGSCKQEVSTAQGL